MNGPTEREQRCPDAMGSESFHPRCHLEAGHDGPHERSHSDWLENRVASLADEVDRYHDDLVRVMHERNEARARVAVLEQQIAEWRGWAQDLGPFALGNRMRTVLAAGVDPTEDEANADPFTLDDLGHPTEPGSPREVDVSQGNANPVTFAPGAISSSWHQMDDPYQRPTEGSPS